MSGITPPKRSFFIGLLCIFIGPFLCASQPEYVFDAPVGLKNTEVNDQRFMELGKTSFWVGIGTMIEFNDNINLDPKKGLSDIILRPNVYTRIFRPVTEDNTLNIIARIGTTKYLSHSQFNSNFTTVSPDSLLSYKFYIKEFEFTLLDRFSIQQDATTSPLINKTVNYNRYENGIGLNSLWKMNEKTEWNWGINRNDVIAKTKDFNSLSRTVYRATMSGAYQVLNPVNLGATLGVYTEKYKEKVQNDNSGNTLTADLKINVSEYTKCNFSAGIDKRKYKHTGTILENKRSNNSFIFHGGISHRLTELTEHGITFSSQPKSGYGTNYYSDFQSSYKLSTKLNYRISSGINLIYQKTKTSGLNPENAKRYFIVFSLDMDIFRDLACSLQLRNLRKKSNKTDNSYTENRITLDISYSI